MRQRSWSSRPRRERRERAALLRFEVVYGIGVDGKSWALSKRLRVCGLVRVIGTRTRNCLLRSSLIYLSQRSLSLKIEGWKLCHFGLIREASLNPASSVRKRCSHAVSVNKGILVCLMPLAIERPNDETR